MEAEGTTLRFYVDDRLAVEVQDSESLSGRFGLNVCDVTGVFQNVYFTGEEITDPGLERPDCKWTLDDANGIVKGIPAGTEMAELIAGFGGSQWVRVTKDGQPISEGLAATGMTAQYTDGEQESYTLAVTGDLDGDGGVTIADVMEACKVMARESAGSKPTPLERAVGDLDDDGDVTIADVMEICKILARQG